MKKFILGNWKMYKTFGEIQTFCESFNSLLKHDKIIAQFNVVIGIAPTYLGIIPFCSFNKTNAQVMAQNGNVQTSGAYTSEISFSMLKEYYINMVIIGHSEVRQHLQETDMIINQKVLGLLNMQMMPILCIGESLQDFENNKTMEILNKQLMVGLNGVDESTLQNLVIAYEPIWAIGTGKTATTDIISKTIKGIKDMLHTLFKDNYHKIAVLYGGSVNEKNAQEILAIDNVDGVLVGGASLDPQKFYSIIQSTPEYIQIKNK